jgi:hypothetical protein
VNARLASVLLAAGFLLAGIASGATLEPLTHQPPAYVGPNPPFLLTDGSVLIQDDSYTGFWKLTPDASGSYLNGTWTQVASIPSAWNYGPYAYSSAVLADGRVLIEGGEYNLGGPFSLTNLGAIYDPVADAWTQVDPPPGWDFIGDASSIVMPNGKFLLGNKLDQRIAELDPATMTWTALGFAGKAEDFNAEEGWTLLPDGTFITVDVLGAPNTERYTYVDAENAGSWAGLGVTQGSLAWNYGKPPIIFPGGTYTPPGETGQCILMPSQVVFCTGASDDQAAHIAHTAILDVSTMTWFAGPDFPPGDDAGDTSAVLMPNGDVLVSATSGQLYEFGDNVSGLTPTLSAGAAARLMTLPNGQVLVNGFDVEVYTPDITQPDVLSYPEINGTPWTLIPGQTYVISGYQFNGVSQAQAFGDEIQAPTNYPLVRLTSQGGRVTYARTHDHSTMGVATGLTNTVWTSFDMPLDIEPGCQRLVVVANGVESKNSTSIRVLTADTIFADTFDFCTRF